MFEGRTLSYAQLSAEVRRIAANLLAVTTQEEIDAGLGLLLRRSERLPVAMLAALHLGAPFIPLEPGMPPERLAHVVASSGLKLVLVDAKSADDALAEAGCHVRRLDVEALSGPTEPAPDEMAPARADGRDAYVLFTSGSTGRPKGARISHRNLLNFLQSMQEHPGFVAGDTILAITPSTFDIALLELLLAPFCGGTVEVVGEQVRRSAEALADTIDRSKATILQATPSTFRLLKSAGWWAPRSLKLLIGGEALSPGIAKYLLEQGHIIYNMYGPTEATIWASAGRVVQAERISLGRPVNNSEFFILDEALQPVPIGGPGATDHLRRVHGRRLRPAGGA